MPTKNPALEATITELTDVRQQLETRRIVYDPKKRLIIVPFATGLWAQCERLTFQAFGQIRGKRDWQKVKDLCIRTPKTKLLYDLIKRNL